MTHAYARATAISVVSLLAVAGAAHAAETGSGGAAVPGAPKLGAVKCKSSADLACASRSRLVRGGTPGSPAAGWTRRSRSSSSAAAPAATTPPCGSASARATRIDVVVPSKARSGRIAVIDKLGRKATTRRSYRVGRAAGDRRRPGSGFYFGGRRKPTVGFNPARPPAH